MYAGAQVNAESGPFTSMTALEHAVEGHHVDIVKFLLEECHGQVERAPRIPGRHARLSYQEYRDYTTAIR